MDKLIAYKDIPAYCDRIDNNKRSTVLLSEFQARLFQRVTQNGPAPRNGKRFPMRRHVLIWHLLCVLVCARYLLLLEHFYRRSNQRRITFTKSENDKVIVTFNPHAGPQADCSAKHNEK